MSFQSDLIGDIEHMKKAWGGSSWSMRGVYIISVFFVISSLTSIADYVFKWRGFISDGVVFYRDYITSSISQLIDLFQISLAQQEIDLIIILSLGAIAIIRKNAVNHKLRNLEFRYINAITFGMIIVTMQFIFLKFLGLTSQSTIWLGIAAAIFTIVTLPYKSKFSRQDIVIFYVSIGIPIVVVLIAAAVNAGLSRTA